MGYVDSVARETVRFDLTSSTDPYLYLMQGHGKSGAKLYGNDDISSSNLNPCSNSLAVACVPYSPFIIYPRFNRQQTFYFEHEPLIGSTQCEWSNNYRDVVNNPALLYMPIYMAHEFGHAAGFWHTSSMSTIPNEMTNLATDDKKAMKATYKNHTPH